MSTSSANEPGAEPVPTAARADAEESTVGTGSVVAIGCTVASLLFILVGFVVFVILQLAT